MKKNKKEYDKSEPAFSESVSSYIYGRNPVIEVLKTGRALEKIYICHGTNNDLTGKLPALTKKENVQFVVYDSGKFAALEKTIIPKGRNSQGIIALLRSYNLISLEEIIEISFRENNNPVLVILDEIADPQNLGAIARSAECAGASGLIITERNSSPVTPVAVKASAGALEHIPVAKVNSLSNSLDKLKDAGFWIFGTDSVANKLYSDKIYDCPVALVIGSEGKGIRQSVKNQCDFLIKIPLQGRVSSLNASVAAGIILFEITRQRRD